ncbi:MAG: aspartate-semialdehyde dehydrogenase [Gemmatimonadota bacterium]
MTARVSVAVLGATGAVGQTFVRLLDRHPYFRIAEVGASPRSVGRSYREAATWREGELSDEIGELQVRACDPGAIRSRIVFSALDAEAALDVERCFAESGAIVLSNAKSYRMEPDVPLVIPEVNPGHLALLELQRERRGWSGGIVTNANCAVTVVAMALAPLHERFGVSTVFATTLQALSGAGYPGVSALDASSNIVPHIGGEEEKIEEELGKLLGTVGSDGAAHAGMVVSAHANRVPVVHGHTACLSVGFETEPSVEEVRAVLAEWRGAEVSRGLPTSPPDVSVLRAEADRPQPRRDADTGSGMSLVIGRVRPDPVLDVRLVAMAHNTVRGAAGGSVLNAEVMGRLGLLPDVEEGSW